MTPPVTPPGPEPVGPRRAPAHRLRYVARTDRGLVRSTNQDSLFAGDRLLVVADGMGGHAAGDTASRLVVDAFMSLNEDAPGPDLLRLLLEATRAGNASIADMVDTHPDLEGMGTTVTAMLFDGGRAALAHVGDSRAYLYRDGVLHQLTHDDTFVQSLVDDGRITEHQAHEHPQRNLLLRALTGLELDPMLVEREIRVGDRYMLCSDGLSGVVDPESIADALAHPDPEIAADTLIQLALVNGGPDNVTTIVADVLATGGPSDADFTSPGVLAAGQDDPSSTNPIARLTREMPRVPLPPIPEEPAAPAEVLDEDGGDDGRGSSDTDDDTDGAATDAADDEDDATTGLAPRSPGGAAGERAEHADGDTDGLPGSTATRHPPRRGGPRDLPRRRWYRRGAVIVAALVLLGVAITGSTLWVRHQYYVAEQGNVVVVFRGVNGSLLGWRFSTFEETSCAGDTDCTPMRVSDLQPAAQNQVRGGIKVGSLSAARTVVQRLSERLLPPCPPAQDTEDDATPSTSAPGTTAPATTPPDTTPPTTRTPASSPPPTPTVTAPAAAGVTAPTAAHPDTTAAVADAGDELMAADAAAPALAHVTPATAGRTAVADRTVADESTTPDASAAPLSLLAGTLAPETRAPKTPAPGTPTSGTTERPADRDPGAANLAGPVPAAPEAESYRGSVTPTSPSESVTATPLAPATQTPGVTCRTVQ